MNCLAQPGTIDPTFNSGNGPQRINYGNFEDALISRSTLLPDGKIIVTGQFKYFDGNPASLIARLNSDGSFDTTFNSSGTGFDSNLPWNSGYMPTKVVAQPDGKILVIGDFRTYNGIPTQNFIRLNSDGTIDNSFNYIDPNYLYSYSGISTITVMPNGKILLSRWNYQNFVTQLLRLNSDGSIDTTFNIQSGFDDGIRDVKLQADGKILVAGDFNNIGGFWKPKIARLNSDSTVDTTFVINAGFNNTVTQIEIAPDGSIFASTYSTTFDNIPVKRIVKLVPSGYLDFSFSMINPELTFLNGSDFILMQNGQLFVLGVLLTNGAWNYNAGMFNSDGSFDNTFLNVFENNVNGALLQPDVKLVCFGNFNNYNGQSAKRMVRINGYPTLATSDFHHDALSVYPNPATNLINFKTTNDFTLEKLIVTDLTGKVILVQTENTNQINIENLSTGMYFITAISGANKYQSKFIKQ